MSWRHEPIWRLLACGAIVWSLAAADTAQAQPKFGLEVEAGRNVGLTPYLRNVVHAESEILGKGFDERESFRPYLADEQSGWGSSVTFRAVSRAFHGDLTVRWFDVSEAAVHHKGTVPADPNSKLRPTRIRPDGTVDDTGVEYREAVEPNVRLPLRQADQARLFVVSLGGGYRFPIYRGPFDVFIPANGHLVLTHLTRPSAPYRPGLKLGTGLAASFDFISIMSVIPSVRIHGLATPSYWHRSDAAWRARELGHYTESALFSTQLFASFGVAFQFGIR